MYDDKESPYRCPFCLTRPSLCTTEANTGLQTVGCLTCNCKAPVFTQKPNESKYMPLVRWDIWVSDYRKEHPEWHKKKTKSLLNSGSKTTEHHFPGMKKDTLYYVYRSMDKENKREFLEEAGYVKFSYWCNSCCRRQPKDICEYCKPDEATGIPNGYRSEEEERECNLEMLHESNALNML